RRVAMDRVALKCPADRAARVPVHIPGTSADRRLAPPVPVVKAVSAGAAAEEAGAGGGAAVSRLKPLAPLNEKTKQEKFHGPFHSQNFSIRQAHRWCADARCGGSGSSEFRESADESEKVRHRGRSRTKRDKGGKSEQPNRDVDYPRV